MITSSMYIIQVQKYRDNDDNTDNNSQDNYNRNK